MNINDNKQPDNPTIDKTTENELSDNVKEIFNLDENIYTWTLYDIAMSPIQAPFNPVIIPSYLRRSYERHMCSQWPVGVCSNRLEINPSFQNDYNFNIDFIFFESGVGSLVQSAMLISVVIQAILLLFVTPISDYENQRGPMFKFSSAMMLIMLVLGCVLILGSEYWWVLWWEQILMNAFQIMTLVIYDSQIPELVKCNPKVMEIKKKNGAESLEFTELSKSLLNMSFGTAFVKGQIASFIQILIFTVIEGLMHSDDWREESNNLIQVIMNLITVIFQFQGIIRVVWQIRELRGETWVSTFSYLNSDNIGINCIQKICQFPDLSRPLFAWFFLSDVTESLTPFMINIWNEFKVPIAATTPLFFMVYILMPLGTQWFTNLREKQNMNQLTILKIIVGIMCVLSLFGQIFLFDQMITVSWIVGGFQGLSVGAIQTQSKAVISQVTPKCQQASVFSLMELTNKGSSWMSPAFMIFLEYIRAKNNDNRVLGYGVLWFLCLQIISFLIFLSVNLDKGQLDKIVFEQNQQGQDEDEEDDDSFFDDYKTLQDERRESGFERDDNGHAPVD